MSIEKIIGSAISANISLEYRGPAITIRAVWGLMPAKPGSSLVYGDKVIYVYDQNWDIPAKADWGAVSNIVSGVYPALDYQADSADKADAVIAIYLPGPNQPSILSVYYKDVYNLPVSIPEFRGLQAVFT